jgi:transcriptional regulator with XRE-family HTH domain
MTVRDELEQLRSWLRASEIAEMTGLRPETISRISSGQPASRRAERLIDDLYYVAGRVRARLDDPGQLRFALNRRRPEYEARSYAEMIREDDIGFVLNAVGR